MDHLADHPRQERVDQPEGFEALHRKVGRRHRRQHRQLFAAEENCQDRQKPGEAFGQERRAKAAGTGNEGPG